MRRIHLLFDRKARFLASLSTLRLELLLPDGTRKTVTGRYDCCRIPDGAVPDDYKRYALRHGDGDDSVPVTIEDARVWVNHYGDFVCRDNLDGLFGLTADHAISIIGWSFDA